MSIASFLQELAPGGRARVGLPLSRGDAPDGDDLLGVLRELDARARAEAPGKAPPFGQDAARWGARALHAVAQGLALRHIPAAAVAAQLARPCPGPPSPGRTWSVDLALHWLPDLAALSRALPEGDALASAIETLGAAWPLSSVGMALPLPRLDAAELEVVLGDDSLARLHADRVLARADRLRLGEPRTRELCRAAIGLYPELCPALAALCTAPAEAGALEAAP